MVIISIGIVVAAIHRGAGGHVEKIRDMLGGPRRSSTSATFAKMLKYRAEKKGNRLPRKSAAALAITPPAPRATRLRPPPSLAEPEASLFREIVANCAADHFRRSDLPLLCRYCEASILAERAAQQLREAPVIDGKPSPWLPLREKATREMIALSMRLRLSPQARAKGHALPGKSRTDPGGLGITWEQLREREEDGNNKDDELQPWG
jgi:phage terminase small subunit